MSGKYRVGTNDREDSDSGSRDLPPLHEVLGDFFLHNTSSPQGSSDSLGSQGSARQASMPRHPGSHRFSYQDRVFSNRGPQLAPISPSRSSQPRSLASTPSPEGVNTSSQRLRSISSSANPTAPYPPTQATSEHSYDLFNYSPDGGLVHKRSSKSQEDLDESKPKPRTTSVDDSSRRYACPECGKRFAKPSTLRNHTLTHTGEKPFVCPQSDCGRRFSMASNMQRHMRTHTSGSAFQIVPSGEEEEFSSGRTSADE